MAQGVHSDTTKTKIVEKETKKLSETRHRSSESDSHRNHWPIAHIIETFPNKHGIVQTIKLRLGDAVDADQCVLVQPKMRIVFLSESDSPAESKEC